MLPVRAVFPITLAMFLVSCAVQPEPDDAEDTLETAATSQELAVTEDAASAAAGCAVVTTCNAPGADEIGRASCRERV